MRVGSLHAFSRFRTQELISLIHCLEYALWTCENIRSPILSCDSVMRDSPGHQDSCPDDTSGPS